MNKNNIPQVYTELHCGFGVSLTNDSSPTLTSMSSPFESMHNRSGAAGETHYIYGPVALWAFENSEIPAFLNVGLGLGYIELLIALVADDRPYSIVSLETVDSLKTEFKNYLQKFSEGKKEENIYSRVLESLEKLTFKKLTAEMAQQLLRNITFGSDFNEWLSTEAHIQASSTKNQTDVEASNFKTVERVLNSPSAAEFFKFNGIFFDPFSEKTSPQIWQDNVVQNFLSTRCDTKCAFSTYAAKGKLNRALKSLGFSLFKKPGYAGKRESTFATRS